MSKESSASGNGRDWKDAIVSIVNHAGDGSPVDISLRDALQGIHNGKWRDRVEAIRRLYSAALAKAEKGGSENPHQDAKNAIADAKKALPAITFSGRFSERRDASHLVSRSGLLCADIDTIPTVQQLALLKRFKDDPHVQFALVSPSGWGLKVGFRIRIGQGPHLQSYYAVERHMQATYSQAIDPACKDVNRLCFVSHDSNILIREDEAEPLEPLEPGKASPPGQEQKEQANGQEEDVRAEIGALPDGLMVLPKDGLVSNSASAASIFKKIAKCEPPSMFVRTGSVVTLAEATSETGTPLLSIKDLTSDTFQSMVEDYGTVFAWRSPRRGEPLLKSNALMSEGEARMLLACNERFRLPPLTMIHNCPLLIEKDGKTTLLLRGYYRGLGGRWIASNGEINIMPLEDAVAKILELIEEFGFAEPSDMSRAVAALITPALRFGGLLRCHFPITLVEADQSQAGKGTLVETIQRIYNEIGELTAKRKGGVGSFDEDMSARLLRGKPFIQIDNVRDLLDSEFLEQCLTCPFGGTVPARVPYRQSVSIDPNRYVFHLTSNKFESTQDLANRSCVIRLRKRIGYQWKTFPDGRQLEAHVEANPWQYLSAVYSIAAHWVVRGKPRNESELRGEGRFREWWQVADWIAQKVFGLPPALDGHEKIQRRVASAGQSWARAIGNLLQTENMLGKEISASGLVDLVNTADESAGVKIPGAPMDATDEKKAQCVGIVMAQLFKNGEVAEVDLYQISRIIREEERPEHRDTFTRKFYIFKPLE